MGRRDFLRVGSLTFLGMGLTDFLRAKHALAAADAIRQSKAQSCILVWLDGGPSQMDTFDPKTNSSFKPISTNVPGIQVTELLPKLARRMDKLALIRSLHTQGNNHGVGTHYVATGHNQNPAMKFPGFGSIITKEMGMRNGLPPHVMVPGMPKGKFYDEMFKAHFLGAENNPLILDDPHAGSPFKQGDALKEYRMADLSLPNHLTRGRIHDRLGFLDLVERHYRRKVEVAEFGNMDTFTEQAFNMITAPAVREAFDLSKESDKTKEAYGLNPPGQAMLLARRLVEAGSRFVTAGGYAGQAWDTHDGNDAKMRDDLCPTFDQSLSTLLDDLEQRGLLESTLIVVLGEFGRTADINVGGGRDHWPECWTGVLAGGGIRGGQVIGASDERGAYVAERMISMGDVFATIYRAFGIDWTKEYMHPIGRPIKIANSLDDKTGVPIEELV